MTEIEPKICAKFLLDINNKPKYYVYAYKHFGIMLFIRNAPKDVHAVTYELHETYVDPVREVSRDVPNFELEITSYGDYEINAKIRQRDYATFISRCLSDALCETYENSSNPDIQNAINYIKEN